jgi:hypothetical protein
LAGRRRGALLGLTIGLKADAGLPDFRTDFGLVGCDGLDTGDLVLPVPPSIGALPNGRLPGSFLGGL